MALTRPKLSHNIDTDSSVFTDPILVLHQSATAANVDSGFLFNRANGLVSNVAIYWSESANSFVTAFSTSAGSTNSNISVLTYANLRTGELTSNSITNSGTLVIGNTGDVSSNIGAFYTYANATFATQAGTTSTIDANLGAFYSYANTKIGSNSNGNLVVAALTQSTSTTTGALVVGGGAAVGGNLYVGGNLIVSNVVYQNSEVITTTELVQGNIVAASSAVSTSTTTGALVVIGGAGIGGALYITNTGDVSANIGAYQTYANANVTAIQANLGAYQTYANANVVAIQANLGAFQVFSNANAATQAISINSIVTNANANTAAYLLTATGNINAGNITTSGTSGNISGVNYIFASNYVYANGVSIFSGTYSNTNVEAYIGGNIGAFQIFSNANAATQATSINTINANIGAYQTYANANVVVIQANLGAYQTYSNANVAAIQANLGAYQTYANANAASQQTQINNIVTQGNANTLAYLSTTSVSINELSVTSGSESTSTTTGALKVTGGAGISGNLYVGGNINIAGSTYIVNSTINNQVTGNLIVGSPITFPALNANVQYGGNQNNYLQLLMQNANSGTAASTDFVAAADNAGSDTDTYIDMGINSSTYNQDGYTATYPNDGYLYVHGNTTTGGGNLILATMTDRDIVFTTGGQNTNNEVMRITSGNVVQIINNQSSTSTTTGALVVAGGIGVGGNVSAAGINVNDRIDWTGTTYAPPTFTTRSAGQKITLYPSISGSTVDYALGINGGVLWSAIPAATADYSFKWYGGETELASLFGAGNLTVISANIASTNTATSKTTGALIVSGGAGIAGNVYADKFYTTNGLYWAGNGLAFSSGLTISEIDSANALSNISNSVTSIRFDRDTGFSVVELDPGNVKVSLGSSFKTWHVPGQADLVAVAEDEVTFFSNSIDITTNPTDPKSITFAVNLAAYTGNITAGNITSSGNIRTDKLYTTSGLFWSGNGAALGAGALDDLSDVVITTPSSNQVLKYDGTKWVNGAAPGGGGGGSGITYTAATAPPVSANVADQWYDTVNDVLYEYLDDGTTSYWVDIQSQGQVGNIISMLDATLSGNIVVELDRIYSIGANEAALSNVHTGNLYVGYNSGNAVVTTGNIVPKSNLTYNLGTPTNWWDQAYVGNLYVNNIGVAAGQTTVISGNLVPGANLTYNIGSSTSWWNTIYGVATQAQYADLAERYQADADYEPGTVVVFGGEYEITISTKDHDPAIAGVISTDPAYLMNAAADGLPVALQGRVPCQVQGPIRKGELVVSSSVPGVAQRFIKEHFEHGCIIGKSLENINDDTIKTIEVVVGRY